MDWIASIITGVLVTAFLTYSNFKSAKEVNKDKTGKYNLRLNEIYKWTGVIATICGIVFLIMAIMSDEEGLFIIASIVILMTGGAGILLLMWYQNHKLIFDETEITGKSWTGHINTVKWEDIDNVKFAPIWGYLKIYSNSRVLNIHMHIVGLAVFVKLMEEKTTYKANDLKLPFRVE